MNFVLMYQTVGCVEVWIKLWFCGFQIILGKKLVTESKFYLTVKDFKNSIWVLGSAFISHTNIQGGFNLPSKSKVLKSLVGQNWSLHSSRKPQRAQPNPFEVISWIWAGYHIFLVHSLIFFEQFFKLH